MPDIKNYDVNDKGLKHADADKSGGVLNQLTGSIPKNRKSDYDTVKRVRQARKRLPIVVDVIIAILILAMIVGAFVGAFYLFRYFTVDYDTVNVEYTVVLDSSVAGKLKNENVYCDIDGNTVYFGKIKKAETDGMGNTLIRISATVRYKEDEGYTLGESRLAVGARFALRTEQGVSFAGTIVEFVDKSKPEEELSLLPPVVAVVKGGR